MCSVLVLVHVLVLVAAVAMVGYVVQVVRVGVEVAIPYNARARPQVSVEVLTSLAISGSATTVQYERAVSVTVCQGGMPAPGHSVGLGFLQSW